MNQLIPGMIECMCGITGILSRNKNTSSDILKDMSESLSRRGPNAAGLFINRNATVGLAHRRLAILDLSEAGNQPMLSSSGRFAITFNGEIYNYRILRHELESLGHKFKTNTDTEVILAAFEQWEMYEAIPTFNGMFALALWDEHAAKLYLVRDRIGVKPLYYSILNNTVLFGSELKSILVHPESINKLGSEGLSHYMRFGYIPAPLTIYENIFKVKQGTILSFDLSLQSNEFKYWSPSEFALGQKEICENPTEYRNSLHQLLRDSIGLRMVADVPLGVFLSGGIDSSLVAALMQEQSTQPIRTFTIGFQDISYNEAPFAKEVADRLGTSHTSIVLNPTEAHSIIPELPQMFDEPFGDSSAIPTSLLAHLTSRHVTVALSGDGGDELFLGYSRYHATLKIWNFLKFFPVKFRRNFGHLISSIDERTLEQITALFSKVLPGMKIKRAGHRLKKFAARLDADPFTALYRNIISHWPKHLAPAEKIIPFIDDTIEKDLHELSFMALYDLISYLPDDIMTKVDRSSMWYGLEAREPLLDHRIVELALKCPNSLKYRGGESKWVLKRILESYLPAHLFDRPKMGFAVPLQKWLQKDLKPWAEDLLLANDPSSSGLLDEAVIKKHWQDHLEGKADHSYLLWDALMLKSWLQHWRPETSHLLRH